MSAGDEELAERLDAVTGQVREIVEMLDDIEAWLTRAEDAPRSA